MKIKMVDVARHLGVSKATVSLAVHNKPGVNPETRRKVLACMEEMQKNGGILPETSVSASAPVTVNQMIKVVIINHRKKVVCDPELDLWSEVLTTFDSEARKRSYFYGLTYMNDNEEERETVIADCNMEIVSGIIVFGTEMTAEDELFLKRLNKPVVIYDCEAGNYSSVCIDNEAAVRKALELLRESGADRVKYLCTGKDIYNFRRRREAFYSSALGREELPAKDDVVELGGTIPEITENFLVWLEHNRLPDAFLFENYQVSIGVMTALRKRGIRVPEKVRAVGIDEIPEAILADMSLTQIKIPHAERAAMAIDLLDKEMSGFWKSRIKVFAEPEVILRDSI